MNRKGMPLFPVTGWDAAWPPATAVSGADAATMKNTRSRVPSARRCSWLPAELAAAVVDDDGLVAGSTADMKVLPSEMVQVLVDFPVRDPRPVALDLEPLDGE